MVEVILQLYPVIYAESEDERRRLRPIGRNRERVHDALVGMPKLVKACDTMGVWGVSCIEHHFHSEGYEVGPNIGLHNGYWAAITENVKIGNLGYSISAGDPIRVAEEVAILDHLTEGRCFVGFARGYQSRWTNVLGQKLGSVATLSDKSEADEQNRRIFEEQVEVVLKAWREDSFEHKGEVWEFPYPHEGLEGWFMAETTAEMGAIDEVDEQGRVRRISVVPPPYSDPHPQVFIASNASIETVEYAGARGFVPAYFSSIGRCAHYGPHYTEIANKAGFNYALGQNQAIVRWPHIADSKADAEQIVLDTSGDIFRNFYLPLFKHLAPHRKDMDEARTLGAMEETGLFQWGTASQVRDFYVEQWKQLPAEYIILIYHYAQMPLDQTIDQLRLFMDEVKPALDELTTYPPARAAAE